MPDEIEKQDRSWKYETRGMSIHGPGNKDYIDFGKGRRHTGRKSPPKTGHRKLIGDYKVRRLPNKKKQLAQMKYIPKSKISKNDDTTIILT